MSMCIRRANLDAMWSREPSTVIGNLNRMRLDVGDAVPFMPIKDPIPSLGRDDVSDKMGMRVAILTLHASLRQGRYTNHLQWDSMRKTPTWWANIFEAGEGYGEGALFSAMDKKVYESKSPIGGRWFPRWLLGAKRRMGVIRKQNEALTVPQLLAISNIAETDYQKSSCERERKDIEEMMSFLIIAFCLSLRGEEVPLTCIDGMLEFWKDTLRHETPHMMITLKGKFKGENNLRWHCVPLADKTKSKIPTRRWISRLLYRRVMWEGDRSGYLFATSTKKKANLGDYDDLFRHYVSRVMKAKPELFSGAEAVNDFSLRRSPRRGATTEAENNNVDVAAIELINRWRKKEAARGAEAGLTMRQVYTQVSRAVKAALRFSQSH